MIGAVLISLILLLITRALYLIFSESRRKPKKNARTLIIIGSGGHTTEMTRQTKKLNPLRYNPRLYVLADSDTSSEDKIKEAEACLGKLHETNYTIQKIPRSRNVNQSYISSIFTTIYATMRCIPIIFKFKPDLILCNGPGTCIPICFISFCMKVLFLSHTAIIFTESICRVKTLSLSGKILLYFADRVLVQWPLLQKKYPKTIYIGKLT